MSSITQPNGDAGVSVNLNADMLEIFQRGLLADLVERTEAMKDLLDSALEFMPPKDVREDVQATMRLMHETEAMLEHVGWGEPA